MSVMSPIYRPCTFNPHHYAKHPLPSKINTELTFPPDRLCRIVIQRASPTEKATILWATLIIDTQGEIPYILTLKKDVLSHHHLQPAG